MSMNKNLQQKLLNSGRSLHERRVIKKMIMEAEGTDAKPDPKQKLNELKTKLDELAGTKHLPSTLQDIFKNMSTKIDESNNLQKIDVDKEFQAIDETLNQFDDIKNQIKKFFGFGRQKRSGGTGADAQIGDVLKDEFEKLERAVKSYSDDENTLKKSITSFIEAGTGDLKILQSSVSALNDLLEVITGAIVTYDRMGGSIARKRTDSDPGRTGFETMDRGKQDKLRLFIPLKEALESILKKTTEAADLHPEKVMNETNALIKATQNMYTELKNVLSKINNDDQSTKLIELLGKNEESSPVTSTGGA